MAGRDLWVAVCGIGALWAGAGLWHGLYGPNGTGTDGFDTPTVLFITLALVNVVALGIAVAGGIISSATSPLALISSSLLVAASVLLEMWIGPYAIPGAVLAMVAAIGWNVALAAEADRLAEERKLTGRRP